VSRKVKESKLRHALKVLYEDVILYFKYLGTPAEYEQVMALEMAMEQARDALEENS